MTIDRKFLLSVVGGSVVYLLQFVPNINIAALAVIVCGVLVSYTMNFKYMALFLLMIFSSMTPDAVNIYTTKIAFLNVAYILVLFLTCLSLARTRENILVIPRHLGVFLLMAIVLVPASITNLFDYPVIVAKDMLLILIMPMCIYFIFRDLSFDEVIDCFLAIAFVKVLTVLFMFLTGFQLSFNTHFDVAVAGYVDEIDTLLILLILTAPFVKENRIRFIILFLLALIGSSFFGVNFLGFGSQIIILSALIALFLLALRPILLVIFCVLVLASLNFDIAKSALLSYKLNNIFDLISNLRSDLIYSIPHSPQVRVIELLNLLEREWYFLIFGNGAGGYFSDQHFRFNDYIGDMDFSRWEIENRIFFNPHNFSFGFLKMGVLWTLFCFYLLFTSRRRGLSGLESLFMNLLIITIFFNFGFAIKTSFLVGIVFILLANARKQGTQRVSA